MSESQPDKRLRYRDTRFAARRIIDPARRRGLPRLLGLLAACVAAWLAWRAVTDALPPDQRAVLFLFVLAVGLWVTEAVPAFAVGLLIMGYLVFVLGTPLVLPEPVDIGPYVGMWSSPVIWLILGGFFLASGIERTGLDRRLLALAMRPAGGRPDRLLLAVMLASAVASMFMSNTSTTGLLIGAVMPLVRRLGRDDPLSTALLVGIPLAASVGGMGTIIGSAPNAIAVGVAGGLGEDIDFVEWMVFGVPVATVLVFAGWWLLSRRLAAGPVALVPYPAQAEAAPEVASRRDRVVVATTAVLTIGMWFTAPLHGIHPAATAMIPIVGLTITSVLTVEDVRSLSWDTLMLVAGGLALGAAVVDTGLAARVAAALAEVPGLDQTWLVFALLALITVALSNVMSNTATVSLVLPVAVALVPGNEVALCITLGLVSSCALLLPVSTPPNAVAFGTGLLRARDLRPGGWLIGLLGPVVVLAWVWAAARLLGLGGG